MGKFDEKARELLLPVRYSAIPLDEAICHTAQALRDAAADAREDDATTVLASGLLDAGSALLLAELIRAAKEVMPTDTVAYQSSCVSVTLPGVESSQGGSGQLNDLDWDHLISEARKGNFGVLELLHQRTKAKRGADGVQPGVEALAMVREVMQDAAMSARLNQKGEGEC